MSRGVSRAVRIRSGVWMRAFHTRQHDIEHDQIETAGQRGGERVVAVDGESDDVAFVAESGMQKSRHGGFVFDGQDMHNGRNSYFRELKPKPWGRVTFQDFFRRCCSNGSDCPKS